MDAMAPLLPEVDFAYDEVTDLHELLDRLRADGPVVRVKYLGAPVWAILDHKELNQAFNDLGLTEMPLRHLPRLCRRGLGRQAVPAGRAGTGNAVRLHRRAAEQPPHLPDRAERPAGRAGDRGAGVANVNSLDFSYILCSYSFVLFLEVRGNGESWMPAGIE